MFSYFTKKNQTQNLLCTFCTFCCLGPLWFFNKRKDTYIYNNCYELHSRAIKTLNIILQLCWGHAHSEHCRAMQSCKSSPLSSCKGGTYTEDDLTSHRDLSRQVIQTQKSGIQRLVKMWLISWYMCMSVSFSFLAHCLLFRISQWCFTSQRAC